MNRAIPNSCFALAISGCMLLKAAGVPDQTLYLVFFSVAMAAILTNLYWIRTIGLIGIGGLSLAHSGLAGHNLAGAVLTVGDGHVVRLDLIRAPEKLHAASAGVAQRPAHGQI